MGISEDLNKLFYKDGFGASSKAYFIKKVKDTYPSISTKEINSWLKDQEVTQVNKKPTQNLDLKITAKPRTFQIDIMWYRTGENLKPFLFLDHNSSFYSNSLHSGMTSTFGESAKRPLVYQ